MRFVIVTGMSGAGKSTTLKMMEDMGYFCVDNMPIPLMTKLTELLIVPNGEITKIALGLDIRSSWSTTSRWWVMRRVLCMVTCCQFFNYCN